MSESLRGEILDRRMKGSIEILCSITKLVANSFSCDYGEYNVSVKEINVGERFF